MKTLELNIGLSTPNGGQLNFVEILNTLNGRGFNLITYRIQESQCKDGVERCLAIKTECPDDWQTQLRTLSDKLGQDCIAIVGFIGHSPYDDFCPRLWVEPVATQDKARELLRRWSSGEKLSDADAAQACAEHERLCRVRRDAEESKPDLAAYKFIGWLEHTLIPDLKDSGLGSTAQDFETLIAFYRNK